MAFRLESGLLALAAATRGAEEPDIINNVFRAAHSIKGGSATVGFRDIAEFTHLLETILDLVREGGAMPTPAMINVLLEAVDVLRELIAARLEEREPDRAFMQRTSADLAYILASVQDQGADEAITPPKSVASQPRVEDAVRTFDSSYRIAFRPSPKLFLSGNDPIRYLDDLATNGELNVDVELDKLPSLENLDTETCYLSWNMRLGSAAISAEDIREIFSWIEDECDLDIDEAKDVEELEAVSSPRQTPTSSGERTPAAARDGGSIRVATKKIDSLVNLVGELVITQSMLSCIGDEFDQSLLDKLRQGLVQLARNTRELQETVLQIRMLPISNLFDRIPRLIHDLSRRTGKIVQLETTGGNTELDKTVLEKLGDPLVHLVRNSMDHGIETPDARRATGKPEQGTLHLHAEHRGGNVLIEITDDGAGLNDARILARGIERGLVSPDQTLTPKQIHELIFEPGFSTATEVTDISGRGVGMDVVRRNVEELGGRIDIRSRAGLGTVITIELPLTLAILEGQLLRIGEQRFVVPLVSIVESLRVEKKTLHAVTDDLELYRLRNEYLPVVHLDRLFRLKSESKKTADSLLVVVESNGRRAALRVDDLLAQQQVVIKSLETNFQRVYGIAGATILGDGSIAMILDIAGIMEGIGAARANDFEESEKQA